MRTALGPAVSAALAVVVALVALCARGAAAVPCGVWGGDTTTWACTDLLLAGPPGALCVVLVPPVGDAPAVCEYTTCAYDAVTHGCTPNLPDELVGTVAGPCATGFTCERQSGSTCGCHVVPPTTPAWAIVVLALCAAVSAIFCLWPLFAGERRVPVAPLKQQ